VEPASVLTQSRTAAVWGAVRNSPISDSRMSLGGRRLPATSGMAALVLLLIKPTDT
jgi:hypothetical protein